MLPFVCAYLSSYRPSSFPRPSSSAAQCHLPLGFHQHCTYQEQNMLSLRSVASNLPVWLLSFDFYTGSVWIVNTWIAILTTRCVDEVRVLRACNVYVYRKHSALLAMIFVTRRTWMLTAELSAKNLESISLKRNCRGMASLITDRKREIDN